MKLILGSHTEQVRFSPDVFDHLKMVAHVPLTFTLILQPFLFHHKRQVIVLLTRHMLMSPDQCPESRWNGDETIGKTDTHHRHPLPSTSRLFSRRRGDHVLHHHLIQTDAIQTEEYLTIHATLCESCAQRWGEWKHVKDWSVQLTPSLVETFVDQVRPLIDQNIREATEIHLKAWASKRRGYLKSATACTSRYFCGSRRWRRSNGTTCMCPSLLHLYPDTERCTRNISHNYWESNPVRLHRCRRRKWREKVFQPD